MRPAIDADERDEIRRLRVELEGIDRRDLIHHSGQDKQKRDAQPQSALLEFGRDDEAAPRKRAPIGAALDCSKEPGTPKARTNQIVNA